MNLASDTSYVAELWPMLWIGMIVLFATLAWRLWFKKPRGPKK